MTRKRYRPSDRKPWGFLAFPSRSKARQRADESPRRSPRYGRHRTGQTYIRRNPKLGSIGTVVVLGAAAYGGYQLYQAASKQPLDRTACESAGGTWHEAGPIGWCEAKKATK